MPKYKIMGERTLVEAWTYIVEADDADEAIEMVENCPDGYCDGITRLQDDQCYQDDTEFSFLEEIVEVEKVKVKSKSKPTKLKWEPEHSKEIIPLTKPKAKKAVPKKKSTKKKSAPKKKKK